MERDGSMREEPKFTDTRYNQMFEEFCKYGSGAMDAWMTTLNIDQNQLIRNFKIYDA